jgi:hypothetical protein
MKKTMFRVIPLILILAVVSYGCGAKFVNKSAATIGAAASIYDIGMQTVADLQGAGYITDEQRTEINKTARIFKNALIVADDMLVAYNNALNDYNLRQTDVNKSKMEVAKIALENSLEFVDSSWSDLAKLINSIKPGTLPEKL